MVKRIEIAAENYCIRNNLALRLIDYTAVRCNDVTGAAIARAYRAAPIIESASLPDGLSLASDGFVACSGATSAGVITGKHGEDSQLDAITSGDNYVVLTVGGDDVDFSGFASSCVDPEVGCGTDTTAYADIETAIDDYLPDDLANVFSYIAGDLSEGTRVLGIGYPNLLPGTEMLPSPSKTISMLQSRLPFQLP